MSNHLLRDLADPDSTARMKRIKQAERMAAEARLRQKNEAEIYLPDKLFPHFGDIRWESPKGLTRTIRCPACGKDIYQVGYLWVWNGHPWRPQQGTLWVFCSNCFYIFNRRISQKTT